MFVFTYCLPISQGFVLIKANSFCGALCGLIECVKELRKMEISSNNPEDANGELNPALESNAEVNIIDIQDGNRGDEGILEGALIKDSEEDVASDSEDDDVSNAT